MRSRGKFVLALIFLLALNLVIGSFVVSANDNPKVTWHYASAWPVNNPLYDVDVDIANRVSKMTNGNFKLVIHPGGEMIPAYEVFDAVGAGAFPAGSTALSYQSGINSAFSLFTATPLYFAQQDYMNWIYQAGGLNILNDLLEPHGLKGYTQCIFDLESGFRSHKRLENVDDYKGVKFRMGTLEGQEILKRLGATTTSISGGELYDAMQKGILDAFEYMTPNVDWDMGFHEVAEYWVAPAWYQSSTVYHILVNIDAFNKLPENYQAIFEDATKAVTLDSSAFMNWQSALATKKIQDYGVEMSKADEEFWGDLKKIAKAALEDFASENPDYARVLNSQMDYLKKYTLWKRVTQPLHSGYIIDEKDLPVVKDEWLK
jgi:TRAP-type mannitol/chloroaromatic compound transport system substrate-binding protein